MASEGSKHRADLWARIDNTEDLKEVVEIMKGQMTHYGVMAVDQYAKGQPKLTAARTLYWSEFWDSLVEKL